MPITRKRLFGPAQLTNAAATKYTVPALTKTRITHILCTNPTGAGRTVTISIGSDAAGTRIRDGYGIAAGTILEWYPMHIMDAAEILQANADANTSVVMVIDGEESTP